VKDKRMRGSGLFLYAMISRWLPPTRCFSLKRLLLKMAGAAIGENVRCVSSSSFLLTGPLSIGCNTWVGHEVLIVGGNASISIGANCDIAPRVTLVSGSHQVNPDGPHVAGEGYSLPISIGDGSWICAGATILGGTTIGERSIVAAGAVVKGDFPSGALIGGVPARVLRSI
jgi:acetyltransferase-like isoleucine patch superfamily enzyme